MTKVETSQAPAAIGPYSQAVCMGRVVFTSGQIPAVPETGAVPEGIEAQAHQSCKNVAAILTDGINTEIQCNVGHLQVKILFLFILSN